MRNEFEEWMRSAGETPSAFMEHNGCYVDSRVQAQWMAFRAGCERRYKHPEKIEWPTSQEIADTGERCRQELIKQQTQNPCNHYWRRMGDTQYCEDCGISEDDASKTPTPKG